MLDFLSFLRNPLLEFNTVCRYSGVPTKEPDTDVNHTYRVAMMGILFINSLRNSETLLSKEKYVLKALLHDTPEIYISDIPRPVKHFNKDIEEAIKSVETSYARKLQEIGFKEDDIENILKDKDKSPEGILLRVLDLLDVAYFSIREVELKGNLSFIKVTTECIPCIAKLPELLYQYKNEGLVTDKEFKCYSALLNDSIYHLRTVNFQNRNLCDKFFLTSRSLVTDC